ncbi:MAG: SlyX family protein [Planctomycetota bacterium]
MSADLALLRRLQALEESALHQERLVERLDEVVREQAGRLERLQRALGALEARVVLALEGEDPEEGVVD